MNDKRLAELKAMGAKLQESRTPKKKATPRSLQEPKQLRATWLNVDNNSIETRVDAYIHWHSKTQDGELLTPEEAKVVLEALIPVIT